MSDKAKRKRYDTRPTMRVQCGTLDWFGKAVDTDDAIIAALVDLPENPAVLLRVHDGQKWWYMDFSAALKIAGYSTRKTKRGLIVAGGDRR